MLWKLNFYTTPSTHNDFFFLEKTLLRRHVSELIAPSSGRMSPRSLRYCSVFGLSWDVIRTLKIKNYWIEKCFWRSHPLITVFARIFRSLHYNCGWQGCVLVHRDPVTCDRVAQWHCVTVTVLSRHCTTNNKPGRSYICNTVTRI
jgi:hypothetical protein